MRLLRSPVPAEGQPNPLDAARQFGPRIVDFTSAVVEDLREAQKTSDVDEQYGRSLAAMLETGESRGPNYVPYEPDLKPPLDAAVRLIAFYLTQFHPIPENDKWWGKGYTEWTSVSKAVPQFVGQYQPHLPDELGFYDLRIREVQERQVQIAKQYGIHGFAFYYYWFVGKRLLERPLDSFLTNTKIDFPFCLIWANENWTRRWDGREEDVLMAQDHSPESDLKFIEDLRPYIGHPNYIRIDGRPLIGVYRADQLPNPRQTVSRWREYCVKHGFGNPLLVAAQTFGFEDPTELGFDAAMQFPPHNEHSHGEFHIDYTTGRPRALHQGYRGFLCSYPALVKANLDGKPLPSYPLYESAFPMWDNTPRVPQRGKAFLYSSPELYKLWLSKLCERSIGANAKGNRLVFLNAWNEWAEGAHLEPDRRYGYAFLKATRETLDAASDRAAPATAPHPEREVIERLVDKPREPVLLYDMGKTGVERLYEGLSNQEQSGQVLQIRRFGIGTRSTMPMTLPEESPPARETSRMILTWLRGGDENAPVRIVTGVRDPIERNIHAFLEVVQQIMPNLAARYEADDVTGEELQELFLTMFDQSTPETWFDAELRSTFGVDVYATPFPHDKGFQILDKGRYRVLIVRKEDLDGGGNHAAAEFLSVPDTALFGADCEDEMLRGMAALLEVAPFPEHFVDRLLSTRYATHFYTPEELLTARARWGSFFVKPRPLWQ